MLFILATGVTFAILLGGIDLSIQAVASLASVILAQLLPSLGLAAFPVAILSGLAFGVLSGVVHVKLRVPSFVATLATGGVVTGIALWVSDGRAITIEEGGRENTAWINATVAGMPVVVLISAVIGIAGFLASALHALRPPGDRRRRRRTRGLGGGHQCRPHQDHRLRRVRHAGGHRRRRAGGSAVERLAGSGQQLLLPAIAAVIVGGTAITGGAGRRCPHPVGALIISIVRIGMTFVGVNIFLENMVFGAVLIAAVAITIDRSKIAVIK